MISRHPCALPPAARHALPMPNASPAPSRLMAPCPKIIDAQGSLLPMLQLSEDNAGGTHQDGQRRQAQGQCRRGPRCLALRPLRSHGPVECMLPFHPTPVLPSTRLSARTAMRARELNSACMTPTSTPSPLHRGGGQREGGQMCLARTEASSQQGMPRSSVQAAAPHAPDARATAAENEGGLGDQHHAQQGRGDAQQHAARGPLVQEKRAARVRSLSSGARDGRRCQAACRGPAGALAAPCCPSHPCACPPQRCDKQRAEEGEHRGVCQGQQADRQVQGGHRAEAEHAAQHQQPAPPVRVGGRGRRQSGRLRLVTACPGPGRLWGAGMEPAPTTPALTAGQRRGCSGGTAARGQ